MEFNLDGGCWKVRWGREKRFEVNWAECSGKEGKTMKKMMGDFGSCSSLDTHLGNKRKITSVHLLEADEMQEFPPSHEQYYVTLSTHKQG